MEKITEIIKTGTSTKYNNIRVVTQEYLMDNGIKKPLGRPDSQVIECGDIEKLKSYGLDKKYPAVEWWPKSLVDEYKELKL